MEIKKTVSHLVEGQKNRPMSLIVAGVLLVVLLASVLYLYFAKSAIQDQQKQLNDQVAALNGQIAELKTQNVEGQKFAREWLATLEKNEVRWSQVIKTIQDMVPLDALTQKPRVMFLSYSGSAAGKLTLNGQTVAGSANGFADISELLNVFNNSSYFKEGYVPSINHGLTQGGQDLLSFVFNVTYQEQLPTLDLSPDVLSVTQQTQQLQQTTKIPRAK